MIFSRPVDIFKVHLCFGIRFGSMILVPHMRLTMRLGQRMCARLQIAAHLTLPHSANHTHESCAVFSRRYRGHLFCDQQFKNSTSTLRHDQVYVMGRYDRYRRARPGARRGIQPRRQCRRHRFILREGGGMLDHEEGVE